MTVSDADVSAKGREVRDKAAEVWLQKNTSLLPDEAREEREGQVNGAFEFIVTMFETHARRDPEQLDGLRDHLDNVRLTFEEGGVTGAIDTVKDYVSGWRGDAAENFREGFIEKFEEIHANQRYLVSMVDGSLEAFTQMLRNQRQDIMDIGDAAIAGLEAVAESGGGGGGLSLGLTVVAAVFGVLAAIPTAGASATVTFAVIAGAASIGASVAANEEGPTTIAGEDVEEVVNRLVEASNALWESVNAVEQDMADKLYEDLAEIRANSHKYLPPRPDLSGFGISDRRSLEVLGEFQPAAG